jgi:hypothetical protein
MDIEGKGFTEFFDSPQKVAGSKRAHTHTHTPSFFNGHPKKKVIISAGIIIKKRRPSCINGLEMS